MTRADAADLALVGGLAAFVGGVAWFLWPKDDAASVRAYAPAPSGQESEMSIPSDMESRVVEPVWVTLPLSPAVSIVVAEDYVKSDGIRLPMSPVAAQRVADRFGAMLPTRTIVDAIWRAAPVKIEPHPMSPRPGASRSSMTLAREHDAIINQRIGGRSGLTAGGMKDQVVGPELTRNPRSLVLYGWHRLDGTVIQPANASHSRSYFDYASGTRLVKRTAYVNGRAVPIESIFADPALAPLVSREGPLRPDQLRY